MTHFQSDELLVWLEKRVEDAEIQIFTVSKEEEEAVVQLSKEEEEVTVQLSTLSTEEGKPL